MKKLIPLLMVSIWFAGCSQQPNDGTNEAVPVSPSDLGKDRSYFANLYGSPTSEKKVSEFDFALPGIGHLIRLNEAYTVQQFASGKVNATVVFSPATSGAIWVKYGLANYWTQEQIQAALGAYESKWSEGWSGNSSTAAGEVFMQVLMPDQAPAEFQSSSGRLAYKMMGNELMIYSSALVQDLQAELSAEEQQKRAVPKF
ncbi:MAG: hypothetical protein ABSF34_04475 [Verrucomicrobiota bacterium]